MSFYIVTNFQWAPGQIISNATYANSRHKSFFLDKIPKEFLCDPDYMARRKTELRLEKVRSCLFRNKPSRKEAIFLNNTKREAEKWREKPTRRDYSIYKLKPIEAKNSCEANYIWYNYCVRLFKQPASENRYIFSRDINIEIARSLRAYWSNIPTEQYNSPSGIEVLYIGTLEVTEELY